MRSRHSRRTVPTNRSATALARGAWTGGHPGARRIGSDTGEMHDAGLHLDEEENVETAQQHRVDAEEVRSKQALGLGPAELGPGRLRTPRRGFYAVATQDPPRRWRERA